MADLLIEAMQARQKGDKSQARQLLAQALVQDPHNEAAWMMMSEVVDDIKLKRSCLQRVLLINPQNEAASLTLTKLDTSPLAPVLRGERYKPLVPPGGGKTPPFTPPFTWTEEDTGVEGLGDLTYPDLTGTHVNQPAPPQAKFDWAAESAEPDKTIERIFNKVSNPDQALQPIPDTNLDWLEGRSKDGGDDQGLTEHEKEARLLDELVGSTVAATIQQPAPGAESAQPAVSTSADTGAEPPAASAPVEGEEPQPVLWDNPKARTDRLVILGVSSLIVATPAESDIPHILGLFNEKKMLRDLLGENAGTIKLDSIERLTANPARSELKIRYRQEGAATTYTLYFSAPEVLDEVMAALQARLGEGFSRRERVMPFKRKVLAPLICLLVLFVLEWVLIAGLPLMSRLMVFQARFLRQALDSLQAFVNQLGAYNILMVGIILALLDLTWLVIRLFKPARLIILEHK
jgi:hypothetical protein